MTWFANCTGWLITMHAAIADCFHVNVSLYSSKSDLWIVSCTHRNLAISLQKRVVSHLFCNVNSVAQLYPPLRPSIGWLICRWLIVQLVSQPAVYLRLALSHFIRYKRISCPIRLRKSSLSPHPLRSLMEWFFSCLSAGSWTRHPTTRNELKMIAGCWNWWDRQSLVCWTPIQNFWKNLLASLFHIHLKSSSPFDKMIIFNISSVGAFSPLTWINSSFSTFTS